MRKVRLYLLTMMKVLSTGFGILALLASGGCDTTEPGNDVLTESYAHVRAAWSPDGNSVAFTATFNDVLGIYAVDTTGANLRLIHAGDALGISWSPTGQHIAYSQGNQIFRTSVMTDSPELIVTQAPSIRPSYSPDGLKLAYVRNGIRVITLSTLVDQELHIAGTSPSWTSDGSQVLATSRRTESSTSGYVYEVFLVRADSLTRTDIFSLSTYDDCGYFSMSPDGRYLVYSKRQAGGYAQVRRANLFSGSDIPITADGGDHPAISPDGEWIVYTRPEAGDGGLWLIRMDGTDQRRLTSP